MNLYRFNMDTVTDHIDDECCCSVSMKIIPNSV